MSASLHEKSSGRKTGKGDDQNDPTETTATLSETIPVVNRLWRVVVLKLILSSP